jgi:hypothetical protein
MKPIRFTLWSACLLAAPAFLAAQETYRYTPTSTFVTHGDTVWWIHKTVKPDFMAAAPSKTLAKTADTLVYLLLRDSVVLLKPTRQTVPPGLARHYRNIVEEAKADKKLQERLNSLGMPPE